MDFVIEARAWHQGRLQDMEIGIDASQGLITDVKRNLPGTPRKRYRGKVLFPSGVDWHVHFRDPGASHKEDFRTGTQGAALGGIGTVLDMPNTSPVVDRRSRLAEKADDVRAKACVDWGLWTTITKDTPNVDETIHAANGVKLFLAHTTGITESLSHDVIRAVVGKAQAAGRWVAFHAEGPSANRVEATTRDHDLNRPSEGEVRAIDELALALPDRRGVHIAHATTAPALEAAARAGFNAGVTPHHLLLSTESAPTSLGKVNPPLRPEPERAALWDRLVQAAVPHLESDHAPHSLQEKKERFPEAPAGVPGVQTLLPLLLYAAKHGDAPLTSVVPAACERPAAQLGLDRGRIAPGLRADFFLVDPKTPAKLKGSELASRCGWTPYEGMPALLPTVHYLAGDVVVEEGHFLGRAGRGQMLPARARPPLARTNAG